MTDNKECINCPGATDHSTAECPMRAPSGEVEAVEVVAWRHFGDATRFIPQIAKDRAIPGSYADEYTVSLMTVAQHQRIVAAKDAEIARLKACEEIAEHNAQAFAEMMTERDNLRAQLAEMWAPAEFEYDRDIHHNPDAKAWADFFVATFPNLADKHDLMLGWFANAMMAMHDFLNSKERAAQQAAVPEGWNPAADQLPGSGRAVLAFYLNSHGMVRRIRAEHIARWTVQAEGLDADPDTECVEYSEQDDAYYILEGWYELIDNWDDYSRIAVTEGVVTHWMDMPAAPAAPQQGDDEPLRCDYCQCELTNPWHGSGIIEGKERRHIHACDACRGKLPGAVECESCRSGNGGYEALYRHACLEVRRLVNDLLAERNGVFPELVSHAFIASESGNDQYRVVMKFESLAQMQAAHNYLARLNADRSAQGEKP